VTGSTRIPKRLVLVVSLTPLLREAVAAVAGDFAVAQEVPTGEQDLEVLLRFFRPDAVVTDAEGEAARASGFATAHDIPLIYVSLASRTMRVLENGDWFDISEASDTSQALRAVLARVMLNSGKAVL
jgi:hypothetical protein